MTKRSLPPYEHAAAKRPSVVASESISNLDRSQESQFSFQFNKDAVLPPQALQRQYTETAAQKPDIECDVSPIEH